MRGNAFDFIRIAAASAVLYSHSYALYGIDEPKPFPGETLGSVAVAVFFSLSGYLVGQSWNRDPSISRFAARRLLRIMPGLLGVSIFVAFIVGPVFTTHSLRSYFLSDSPWRHLYQSSLMLGAPPLKGVFEGNPYPNAINGSLWTLRYEILMYTCLALIGASIPKSLFRVACPAVFFAFGVLFVLSYGSSDRVPFVWRFGTEFYVDRIGYLGAFFFAGATMHAYRVKPNWAISIALIALALLPRDPVLSKILLWLAIPYSLITVAYLGPSILRSVNGYDFSYGIYIYAFPIQQAVSQIGVQHNLSWLTVLIVSSVATVVMAAFSWYAIERPALSFKAALASGPSVVGKPTNSSTDTPRSPPPSAPDTPA